MSSRERIRPSTWSVRGWILLGTVVLGLLVVAVYVLNAHDRKLATVNEAKKVRTTTAVVKAKDVVKFDEKNHSYISNLDDLIEVQPGTEYWRVYYQIDNFDQVPGPKRGQLWQSEETRIKKLGFRFHSFGASEKEFYDRTQIGDRLEIQYRYMGDKKEIISVRNLTHPDG